MEVDRVARGGEEHGTVACGPGIGERAGRAVEAVIPAMAPHGLINTGDEPVKVVGFFCEAVVTSTFEGTLEPLGVAQPVIGGAAVPA